MSKIRQKKGAQKKEGARKVPRTPRRRPRPHSRAVEREGGKVHAEHVFTDDERPSKRWYMRWCEPDDDDWDGRNPLLGEY